MARRPGDRRGDRQRQWRRLDRALWHLAASCNDEHVRRDHRHRAHPSPDRSSNRPLESNGRRSVARWLAGVRSHPARRGRRTVPHDPPLCHTRLAVLRVRSARRRRFARTPSLAPAATSSSAVQRRRARRRFSMHWPHWSRRPNASSHSKTLPSCGSRTHTSCDWKRDQLPQREPARSRCRTSCARPFVCVPTVWCSARYEAPRLYN